MNIEKLKEVLTRPVIYKTRSMLGLDIGSRFIKVVQLKQLPGVYKLEKVGLRELPLDVIVEGEIMDTATLVDLISSFIEEFETEYKDVTLMASGRDVLVKAIDSEFKEREILRRKSEIARTNIPYDITDVCYDIMVQKAKPIRVVVAAAKNEKIYPILGMVQEADLIPIRVTTVPVVLTKLFRSNGLIPDEGDHLVVSVGDDRTHVVLIRDGVFRSYLDIRIGIDTYLKDIAREQAIPVDEAVPVILGEEAITKGVAKTINADTRNLVQQIKGFLKTEEADCKGLILTGEGANIPGLQDSLDSTADVESKIGDPFTGISVETPVERPNRFDIAVGLAIVGIEETGLNLLPAELLPRRERKTFVFLMGSFPLWIGGLTLIGLLVYYFQMGNSISRFRTDIQSLRTQETTVKERMALLQDLKRKRGELTNRIKIVKELEEGKYSRVELMDELNRILPPYTWLTLLKEEGGGNKSFGVLISGVTGSNLGASEFLKRLEDSPHFSGVELSFTKTGKSGGVEITEFEIRATFNE